MAIGDGAVGKTSILLAYTTRTFQEDQYEPTIFENLCTNIIWRNRLITLSLYDTAGNEEYDKLRPLSYSHSDVFMLCYSTVNKSSFENVLNKWKPELLHYCPCTPIVLVGTMTDLRSTSSAAAHVTTEMGNELRKEIEASEFMECSSKTFEGIDQVFKLCLKTAYNHKRKTCGSGGRSKKKKIFHLLDHRRKKIVSTFHNNQKNSSSGGTHEPIHNRCTLL